MKYRFVDEQGGFSRVEKMMAGTPRVSRGR